MPPKTAEQQHKRDKSPDNKHQQGKGQGRKNSGDDESKMEKLKDKMGGLLHGDKDDKEKARKQDGQGRQRSRSRERKQSPGRQGAGKAQERSRSRERKQSPGRQGAGKANERSRSRERKQSPGRQGQQHQGQQQPLKAAGASAGAAHHGGGQDQRTRTKRGLCWPTENKNTDPERFTRPGSKVSWYYNWSPHPTKGTGNLQFVPMQWNAGGIKELATNVQKADARAVMAFNEPELGDQANMSADDAAKQWMEHMEPLRKRGVRCGSPGISNAGHAVQWMQDFWQKIKRQGSDVDYWCFHWYGPDLGPFYDYIWSTHHQLDPKKPVWITEFAATNWDERNPLPKEHVEKFAQEAFKYLDSLDWVERYCWFAPTKDIGKVGKWARMYNDEGNLTDIGKMFRDG